MSTPSSIVVSKLRKAFYPFATSPSGCQVVASFQKICGVHPSTGTPSNPFLHAYFKIASALGEEIFFLIPVLWWLNYQIACNFMHRFMILLMTGQLLKDILTLPRPTEAKDGQVGIHRLEKLFETEYGFPSTHTISGLLPITVYIDLVYMNIVPEPTAGPVILCIIWLMSMMGSRLYLGVHSPFDIAGGLFIGVFLTVVLQDNSTLNRLTEVFFTSHYAAITSTVLICAYISFYPRAAPWRAGFGTSAQILGPWYGCSLGLSLASNHFPKVYKDLIGFLKGDFKQDTIHICIDLILVGVTKLGTKIIARKILLFLQRRGVLPVSKSELVDIYGNTVAPEKAYYVEVPLRVFNYASIGFVTVFVAPFVIGSRFND